MFIKKLELIFFRGFERITVDLNPDLNIFVGVNGAGKTSVLDACSMVMNHIIGRLNSSDSSYQIEHSFHANDVNYLSKEGEITLHIEWEGNTYPYTLKKNVLESGSGYEGDGLGNLIQNVKGKLDASTRLPILLYFNQSKDFSTPIKLKDSSLKSQHRHIPQLEAYRGASNKKTYSFSEFGLWWRIEEDKENEKRLRENPEYRNPDLEVVRGAQKKFLEVLKGEKYENLFISRSNPSEDQNFFIPSEGDLFVKKGDQYIKLSQLSDGEKQVFLLVSDIARRLVIANPDADQILHSSKGIVLIDEVDQHLHPAWQRNIIPALLETFPSLQFLVTTHSPQVLSKVQQDHIFLIDSFKLYDVPETYGRDSNEILELVFEVPESPFKEKFKEIYRLISQKNFDEARDKRDMLVEEMGEEYNEINRIDQFLIDRGSE